MCQVDWFASLASLLSVELENETAPDSQNHIETWLGKKDEGRDNLVVQNLQNNLAIIQNQWKYIPGGKGMEYNVYTNTELGNSSQPQLYYLLNDINEQSNLVDAEPHKVEK